jgi:hypothetical protein
MDFIEVENANTAKLKVCGDNLQERDLKTYDTEATVGRALTL